MRAIFLLFPLFCGDQQRDSLNLKETAQVCDDLINQALLNKTTIERLNAILAVSRFIVEFYTKINTGVSTVEAIGSRLTSHGQYIGNNKLRIIVFFSPNLKIFVEEEGHVRKRSYFWRPLGIRPTTQEPEEECLPGFNNLSDGESLDEAKPILEELAKLRLLLKPITEDGNDVDEYLPLDYNLEHIDTDNGRYEKPLFFLDRVLYLFGLYLLMCCAYILSVLFAQNMVCTFIKVAFFMTRNCCVSIV